MKLPFSEPYLSGTERSIEAKRYRDLATEVSRLHPQAVTRASGEEADHGPAYPANFTKGLLHDKNGLLAFADDYRCFVEAINSKLPNLFEKQVVGAHDREVSYHWNQKVSCGAKSSVGWRGWESPRAGHTYDLEGPDMGAVGMGPAPRVGSSELAAEMAEVYAVAILRDVPFTEIANGGDRQLCGEPGALAVLPAAEIAALLAEMKFYEGEGATSSTPRFADGNGFNRYEVRRRQARLLGEPLTPVNLFRGSTPGAHAGPYISQFMLIGTDSRACGDDGVSSYPGLSAPFDLADGFVPYGSLIIDQRTVTHKACLDYMTDWCSWLDVQNGANVGGIDLFEANRRFITTPRDLATYVHYDALYQAYLNAGLVMLSLGVPKSKGFPEDSPSGRRVAFANFGGPHVLSLVTEVATRCLKAVRRQKFNYHRRARPEALGGRLTLSALECDDVLGSTAAAFAATLAELPNDLVAAIVDHNKKQTEMADDRMLSCVTHKGEDKHKAEHDCEKNKCEDRDIDKHHCGPTCAEDKVFEEGNLLLPMAFPEGSPMHPAYGAGHATVAGGCVTMLKAFFEMFTDHDGYEERVLTIGDEAIAFVPNADGSALEPVPDVQLTIQGELDKLAANISIGRNMAGVHYYSDYYDSLRMGERIAVGILLEQAPGYGEAMETTFTSFDGDHIIISGNSGSCPTLSILDLQGRVVDPADWWLRHVAGRELSLDL